MALAAASVSLIASCAVGRLGPTPGPSDGSIAHPTGATDLVLRVFVGGGFVPPGFLVTEASAFSLYGDGRLIFREQNGVAASPIAGITQGAPFRSVQLSEPRVQALLADALYTGGLAKAQPQYVTRVADAPSTVFTFNAGGVHGQVSVNGLGMGAPEQATDAAILSALASLRDRLLAFGSSASGSEAWQPDRYRGYLLDVSGPTPAAAISWPWPSFSPSTWTNVADERASLPFPTRLLTAGEVAALGLGPLAGGATGIVVRFPAAGGKRYGVSLRPLLPDETT